MLDYKSSKLDFQAQEVTASQDLYWVDPDSHIQELPGSWELYLDEQFADRRPSVIDNPYVSQRPKRNRTWYIDGQLVPKNQGHGGVVMSTPADMTFAKSKPVPVEVQACTDPVMRAKYMEDTGICRSVMYSTLFLQPLTDDLVYEAALMRSWNRWMSDMCKKSLGRLTFGALIPIRDPHLAIKEMQVAKELGAAAVMILPTAGERHLHDPLLDPFWSEAQNLGMPVAIHIGWPNPRVTYECTTPSSIFLGAFETSVWWGYLSIFTGGILDRFPNLKVAFLEHDSQWFKLFLERAMHWYPTNAASPWPAKKSPLEYLKEHQIFFVFEGKYSFMPEFLKLVGEDRVMGALDFPHTHYGTASLSESFDFIKNHKHLTDEQKRKVLRDNSVAFYGFSDV